MKIRLGYVSNSSSSSYICQVCGDVESGYDLSLQESGMVRCAHGHVFCEGHLLNVPAPSIRVGAVQQALEASWFTRDNIDSSLVGFYDDLEKSPGNMTISELPMFTKEAEDWVKNEVFEGDVPIEQCPICQFKALDTDTAYRYLLKRYGLTDNVLLEIIQQQFPVYADYERYVYGP